MRTGLLFLPCQTTCHRWLPGAPRSVNCWSASMVRRRRGGLCAGRPRPQPGDASPSSSSRRHRAGSVGLYPAGLAMARAAGPALDAPDRIVESMRREFSGLPARLSVSSLVRSGRVANELARAAGLTGAAAIVLGTGSWQPAGIGEGVYGRLARRANAPVIEIGSRRRAAAIVACSAPRSCARTRPPTWSGRAPPGG
jgi:hypothetical protein